MKSWSRIWKRGRDGPSSSRTGTPVELVNQTRSLNNHSDGVASDGQSSSTAPHPNPKDANVGNDGGTLKHRWRALLPHTWEGLLDRWRRSDAESDQGSSAVRILPNGTRVSPPVSPLPQRWGSPSSSPIDHLLQPREESVLSSLHPAEYYAEKLEVYNMKYSYLKSWPGLLRLLAGMQLLFGGMVFTCVCAYIQKDSQWSNVYGLNAGLGVPGNHYAGPMTPFVLAVVGLSWVVTLILLVIGFTMYYRSILLDSPWWPLTEATINLALFLLYMAAGIVYLNDLNRGGLCYMTVGVNPLLSKLCRVDGGQVAGTAFIFITMVMYIVSFLVCLKMWRHEAARLERQHWEREEMNHRGSASTGQSKPRRIVFEDQMDSVRPSRKSPEEEGSSQQNPAGSLDTAHPSGHAPTHPSGHAPTHPSGHAATHPSGHAPTHPSGHAPTHPSGHAPAHPSGHAPTHPSGHAATHPSGHAPTHPSGHAPTHPSGHAPKARVVADYILKYPVLLRVEDRDRYKAVFNDQYHEYKDLHAEVSSTLARFTQMDHMMDKLLRDDNSKGDKMRIDQIWQNYKQKKNDPAFLEKKERCEYLKAKLSHIKNRIRDYDQNTVSGGRR